jgi:hypothetical protein
LQLPGDCGWRPEQAIGCTGDGPGLGKLYERAQVVEHGILLK